MVVRKSEHFLNGELSVSRTGVYTNAHLYRHPKSGTEVTLFGMLHTAEPRYYEQVKASLDSADAVLYESVEENPRTEKNNDSGMDVEISDKSDFLFIALYSYFSALDTRPIKFLTGEGRQFSPLYTQDNWFCADFINEDSQRARDYEESSLEAMMRRMVRISEDKSFKFGFVLGDAVAKIRRKTFTKKDFAKTVQVIFDKETLGRVFGSPLTKARDLYCFEKFDEVVADQNPQTIGIKYGAAHMAFQRRLLRQRGYEHVSSKKLFCVRF